MHDDTIARHDREAASEALRDRALVWHSVPIFGFWVTTFIVILQARFHKPAKTLALDVMLCVLFFGSPLWIVHGWLRFVRHRKHHHHDLKLGRNVLIAASILAAPLVLYVLTVPFIYP